MATNLLPKKMQQTVVTIIYCAVAIFAIFCLILVSMLLAGMTGLFPSVRPADPQVVIAVFAVCISMMCAVLWFACITDVIEIRAQIEKRIWNALIVGILTAVVSASAHLFTGGDSKEATGDNMQQLPAPEQGTANDSQ